MKAKLFLFVILLILISGCADQKPLACTEEAKVCPDGSAVGRTAPNCEFAACPSAISIEEARAIAEKSECTEKGTLKDEYVYNENSKTFWISLEMKEEFKKDICNPACVVSEDTKTAEINWRCTGLLPQE